jgi:beta-lactamase superfamily II metal-dependent hydrolase/catechol 2,3-dioxygenase-like lactoylglutathione lyase family enzyme
MTAKELGTLLRKTILVLLALACLGWQQPGLAQAEKPLDIYFIDVEGGQSTLLVSPSGESLLIDAGNPGARDADRIAAVAKQAGLTQIDYVLVTHYDSDHVGGVSDVATRIPIRNFVDHGPRLPSEAVVPSPNYQAFVDRVDAAYAAARAKGRHIEVKPGDKVPIQGLDVQIVTAQGAKLASPLAGAGAPNPLCRDFVAQEDDKTENLNSVGSVISLGRFRMLDLGDLTWNKEKDLVCPNNLLGTVDVYLTTHHGLNLSGPPVIVHAVRPRVAIMNNGPKKGDSSETWKTLKSSPGLEDIWQLHYSVARPPNASFHEASPNGGPELNSPESFIANMEETANHTPAYAIKIAAKRDGSFTVTNLRNDFKKEYAARPNRVAALPMPAFHHIHINSTNPERSIEWYSKYWPEGRRTTVAGFPAFEGSDLYLLYNQVGKHAPGAFDRKLHRSVPQSPFWTFGSGVTDSKSLVDRLTKLDAKAFQFLPVYAGPDDKKGVIRSGLAPQGDQLLTLSQLKERAEKEKGAPPQTRPGNQDFGYLVDPDGMLVEFNQEPRDNFWAHTHFWHEQPLCTANWYADHLGMALPGSRDPQTRAMVPREKWDPCDVPIGEVGYPSFMPQGQLRIPIGNVRLANGSWAWYTRQCRSGRCGAGNDKPLVPSAGLVVDHVGLAYPNLDDVLAHLKATGVPIVKGPYAFGATRAVMIEDPDGLSLELIEVPR